MQILDSLLRFIQPNSLGFNCSIYCDLQNQVLLLEIDKFSNFLVF